MDVDSLLSFVTDQGIVGAAFIYLLWYFVNKNNKMLESMSQNFERFGNTLDKIDSRIALLEEKVANMEGKQDVE